MREKVRTEETDNWKCSLLGFHLGEIFIPFHDLPCNIKQLNLYTFWVFSMYILLSGYETGIKAGLENPFRANVSRILDSVNISLK